ncbi:RNA polymerase sigma factor [Archangium lansingense]|uniref:Sigma-70 family RNA polymerase sigma factor n=1 Tax=Archangium lansingense TaxID=2995310 RepID=A0ABT4A4I5_9BACT|nr:sigma-70 family RNA polymerase sigma factor [Archangium lansinium]MCY1076526.1 sigma-70 family RNA polymerase sigma factor [Archangium lansinium]
MDSSARQVLEQRIRECCQRGDIEQAVKMALEGYGPEFLRLLGSILHDRELARDAYGAFSERLLLDLPDFRWECSFRTWAYQVARHIGYRMAASSAAREEPVSHGALQGEVQPERSQTSPWLQTTVKARFRALREQLTPHEQTILMLRLDRRMSWHDVARNLASPDEALSPGELNRRAAVLRQQFQRIKEHLRELAREAELFSSQTPAPF